MTDRRFAKKLRGALDSLQCEYPSLYARMVAAMGDREVLLSVDGEDVSIRFTGPEAPLPASAEKPAVFCATTSAAIVELAEGKHSIEDALWSDRILLRGAIPDLLAFHDALMAFLHGAVRSPSFPKHLSSFKRDAPAGNGRALVLPSLRTQASN